MQALDGPYVVKTTSIQLFMEVLRSSDEIAINSLIVMQGDTMNC